jgi:general secretion pathway protein F
VQAYSYAALDRSGKTERGQIEAESKRHARQLIRERGLTALSVDLSALRSDSATSSGPEAPARRSHVRVAQLASFTRQMAIILKAGIPLEEALAAVARQTAKGTLRGVVHGVRSGVLEGRSLAQSLRAYPNAFSHLYCATVDAGEKAGHLDVVMEELADFTERSHANVQRTRLALVYPVLLFLMSMSVVVVLMVFVVPDIVEVYVSQGSALPPLTQLMIDTSAFLRTWGIYLLLAVLMLVMWSRALLAKPALRLRWHQQLLRLPLLGSLMRKYNAARFASTLSILSRGGVPLVDAIRIAGEVLSNDFFRQQIAEAAQQVEEGVSLHRALEQRGQFPPLMLHMIASGEAAGELDTMLARVAEYQQQELDNLVATMVGLFEPATLLIMGAVVLVIVVAILQPILSLNQLI